MNYDLPLKALLDTHFEAKSLNGGEKFLLLCGLLAKGTENELTLLQVRKSWLKTVMKIVYNPSQYHRARSEGWVKPAGKSKLTVTDKGYEHLAEVQLSQTHTVSNGSTELEIFNTGKTHDFDKFLRTVFSGASSEVMIADSYVDETIFDNLLDQIPDTVTINFLYGNKQGAFDARVKRFARQYSGFASKQHFSLHDRFLIVDDTGYIIGPSLKDAARKSPATVVRLSRSDTKKLAKFFQSFWAQAK